MRKRDRERYADAVLALVDTVVTERSIEGSEWRALSREHGRDRAGLVAVAASMGFDLAQFEVVWNEAAKAVVPQWKSKGLPMHYPDGATNGDAYDGAVALGLEVAAFIREGCP